MQEIVQIRRPDTRTRAMGRAMAAAFRKEPNFVFMLPRADSREQRLAWFFGSFVARLGLRYGEVYASSSGGGGAIWMSPGMSVSPSGALRSGLLAMPFRLGLRGTRRAMSLSERIETARSKFAPPMHWYLLALGVRPEDQGQGLGRSLLEPVLTRADRERTPCYLETFRERTAAFYRNLGFEIIGQDAVPGGGPTFFCMTRQPNASGFLS